MTIRIERIAPGEWLLDVDAWVPWTGSAHATELFYGSYRDARWRANLLWLELSLQVTAEHKARYERRTASDPVVPCPEAKAASDGDET